MTRRPENLTKGRTRPDAARAAILTTYRAEWVQWLLAGSPRYSVAKGGRPKKNRS